MRVGGGGVGTDCSLDRKVQVIDLHDPWCSHTLWGMYAFCQLASHEARHRRAQGSAGAEAKPGRTTTLSCSRTAPA